MVGEGKGEEEEGRRRGGEEERGGEGKEEEIGEDTVLFMESTINSSCQFYFLWVESHDVIVLSDYLVMYLYYPPSTKH